MKRLITLTFVFTAVCCMSCKEEKKDTETPANGKKYVVGSYYNVDGVEGIVYKTNGTKGMIVSLEEGENLAWAKDYTIETKADDFDNGAPNMEKIKKIGIADYPAFEWCDRKNTGGVKGWYLPAEEELIDLANVFEQLQDVIQAHKGTAFEEAAMYWSSSETDAISANSYYARALQLWSFPYTYAEYKNETYKVRAVHPF